MEEYWRRQRSRHSNYTYRSLSCYTPIPHSSLPLPLSATPNSRLDFPLNCCVHSAVWCVSPRPDTRIVSAYCLLPNISRRKLRRTTCCLQKVRINERERSRVFTTISSPFDAYCKQPGDHLLKAAISLFIYLSHLFLRVILLQTRLRRRSARALFYSSLSSLQRLLFPV